MYILMKIIAGNLYDAKKVWTPAVVVTWTSLESSNWILAFSIALRLAHPFSSFSLVKKIVDLQKRKYVTIWGWQMIDGFNRWSSEKWSLRRRNFDVYGLMKLRSTFSDYILFTFCMWVIVWDNFCLHQSLKKPIMFVCSSKLCFLYNSCQ